MLLIFPRTVTTTPPPLHTCLYQGTNYVEGSVIQVQTTKKAMQKLMNDMLAAGWATTKVDRLTSTLYRITFTCSA